MKDMELKSHLTFCQKALDIVLAIDHVRDAASGPLTIFSGIAHVLCDQFQADVCLLYVMDRETSELELRVIQERDQSWRDAAGMLSTVCVHEVLQRGSATQVWEAKDILPPTMTTQLPPTFRMAAIPVELEGRPLGVVLLGRNTPPFEASEVALMEIAESQMDSAVVQAYTYHDLVQRNKELETIYRFDQIRDQYLPFDEMLDLVLQELCRVVEAEMGFVMLYDKAGKQLEMRAVTHDDLLQKVAYYEAITRTANAAIHSAQLVQEENDKPPCIILAIPLILRNEIIGVFGAVNRDLQHRFTRDQQRLLKAIVSQMDTAIFESLEQRRLRRVLGRSVDPHVLDRMLAKPDVDILKGERMLLTVLYADLRGSTAMALKLAPETLVQFVNDYLGRMTEVIHTYEGTLDKYIGDEVMALFGAPLPQPDHALRAVRAGLEMQNVHQKLVADWAARGVAAATLGIGIATGESVVGEFGCELRTDYTVIGPMANLGARICAVAKPGEVLISQETYDMVKDAVEATPIHGMHFKGIDGEVTVYAVRQVWGY